MNSALRGVSSSLCCSHDLAGALLCSRLFGIQGMTPSLGWSHSTQCGESVSSAWYPVLPSCPPATRGSAVHGDPHLGCPVLLGPPSTYVPLGGSTIAPSSGGDHAGWWGSTQLFSHLSRDGETGAEFNTCMHSAGHGPP